MKKLSELNNDELDQLFELAFHKLSVTQKKFPQDTLLHFYSYYKHATNDNQLRVFHHPENGEELVTAFKANALFQIKKYSQREAKIKYIELAQKNLGEEFS